MRYLIFLSTLTLFFTSCSNQKEIEKYQKQLRESNEALEEVIDFRRLQIRSRAVENPERALKWLKVTEVYDSICEGLTNGEIGVNNQTMTELRLISDTLFLKNRPEDLTFGKNSLKDSLLLKNKVLNHLNKWLQRMTMTTDPNSCGYIPLQITPTFINLGDSTMVIINSNFCIGTNAYLLSMKSPKEFSPKTQQSLGYFILPSANMSTNVSGELEFTEPSTLRAFKMAFTTDTTNFVK